MEKTVKISEINYKGNYVVEGENTSTIVSELVNCAAKYCDYYASDVIYDVNAFMSAVETEGNYDRYLCFYDSGVHAANEERLMDPNFRYCEIFERGRACYHLTYDPETKTQKLERICVYVSRGF